MAAGFSIVIGAADNASATIERLNKRMAAMRAPAERLQKSLGKFADLSGISGVAKGFANIGRGAMAAFQSVARVVAPLSAITGAASIAGMYRLVESWASWAQQLGFSAQRIGITAGSLQTLQGAAALSGASADAMRSGLQALGQTMYDAIGGRAPETTALMNQLGVAISDGAGHARSVTEVLPQLADKIASVKDPYTQARIATQLFGGAAEALLPFLRKGSAGIVEYQRKAAAYGITNQAGIDGANRMREAQAGVSLAVQGLTNSIAERLSPIITPLLTQMGDWIARNREWIATGIGEKVKQFADWVQTIDFKAVVADVRDFATRADNIATALGGWKNVLLAVVGIKLGAWALGALGPFTTVLRMLALIPGSGVTSAALGAVGISGAGVAAAAAAVAIPALGAAAVAVPLAYGLSKAVGYDPDKDKSRANMRGGTRGAYQGPNRADIQNQAGAAKATMAQLQGMGYTPVQAAGLAANFKAESGFNPSAVGDGGNAYGIGQWHGDRQAIFKQRFGHDIQGSTLQEQVQFADYELHNNEKGALRHLQGAQTASEAGAAVSRYYERPAAVEEAARNRGAMADALLPSDGSPVASQMAKAGAPPAGAAGASGASGKVDVAIKISGSGVQSVTASGKGDVNQPKIASTAVGSGNGGA